MRLTRTDGNQLTITIKQSAVHFLGLLMILTGILIFLSTLLQYTIVCRDKQLNLSNQCTLESNLFNLYHSNTMLGNLKQAVIKSSGYNMRGGVRYWLYLQTDKHSFSFGSTDKNGYGDREQVAQAINNYIAHSLDTKYTFFYPTDVFTYCLLIFIIALGISFISFSNAYITFDKDLQKVTIKRKGWFKTKEFIFALSDIDKIIVQKLKISKRLSNYKYRLALSMKNNTAEPFINTYDFFYLKKELIASQINEFITQA